MLSDDRGLICEMTRLRAVLRDCELHFMFHHRMCDVFVPRYISLTLKELKYFRINYGCQRGFNPSARWARRGIVVPFVRRRLRRHTQPFGYYTNIAQQIKFIIHANIKPIPPLFLPDVKAQGQRFKKYLVNTIT